MGCLFGRGTFMGEYQDEKTQYFNIYTLPASRICNCIGAVLFGNLL